ncbi:hypothetical protein HPB47_011321 [Ixodes persulcatus]|uniref:Uncharacterized protein n=1 Tax=Ixodes persulcatus TaxID=34615 RepID=A0AC60NWQ5_IXOPE|nr:hypothetical protein HPB47_011321 [Ixodes persulcatus]
MPRRGLKTRDDHNIAQDRRKDRILFQAGHANAFKTKAATPNSDAINSSDEIRPSPASRESAQTLVSNIETGRKKVDICREYGISMSTLSTFMNHKDAYRTAFQESRYKARKLRRSNTEDLSRALLRWYHQSSALGMPINGSLLRNKAQHLARCLGYQDFTVSTAWIHRFRRRHCLNEHDQQYKNARQDLSDADAWLTTSWPQLSSGYSPWDIFSAVEVGVLFRVLPGNARQFRGSICEQGQCADERLTVFLCANMAGDEKRPLLAVGCGPLSKPAAASSVRYGFNERAWMTREIFVEELKRWDCELDARKRKILLLVDHCPCHLVSGKVGLRNIEVVYPPPNKGGNLLPLDHGVVQVFKRRYRKVLLVHSVLQEVPRPPPLEEALRLLNSAWKKVKGPTVRLAFAACGLHSDNTFDDSADDSDNIPLEEWASQFNLSEDLVSGIWEYDCIDDFLVTSGKLEAEGLHAYPGAWSAVVSCKSEPKPPRTQRRETEIRSSRGNLGLPPELGPLPPKTKPSRRTTMANQSSQTPAAAAVVYLPVEPRTPTPFHGEVHKDIEDWLQRYERYPRRQEDRAYVRPEHAAARKIDVWRTADRRPLCYHCGEADHVYLEVPYRQMVPTRVCAERPLPNVRRTPS